MLHITCGNNAYESTHKGGGVPLSVSKVTCSMTFPVPDPSESRDESGTSSQTGEVYKEERSLSVVQGLVGKRKESE